MPTNTLCKAERLRSKILIGKLFSGDSRSFSVYPLRTVYKQVEPGMDYTVTILISVSKRRFKRAVKRNLIKRQIREAYRKNKHELIRKLDEQGKALAIAFIYVADDIKPTAEIEEKLKTALSRIQDKME